MLLVDEQRRILRFATRLHLSRSLVIAVAILELTASQQLHARETDHHIQAHLQPHAKEQAIDANHQEANEQAQTAIEEANLNVAHAGHQIERAEQETPRARRANRRHEEAL